MSRHPIRSLIVDRAARRKRRQDIAGILLIVATLGGFAGMAWAAYEGDKANGITVQQSLKNWGF